MPRPLEAVRRAGGNVSGALRRALARQALPADGGWWVRLRLTPPLLEHPAARVATEPWPSLLDVLQTLEAAAADPDVDGVCLELAGEPAGWGRTGSLCRAIAALRAAGKPVAVFAETFDAQSLLLASAASRIWLPESGQVFLVGLRADAFYLRDLLARIDVRPEVVRVGTHKTAGESLTRDRMSPEQREQLEALVDDWFEALVDGIAVGRGLSHDSVRELIDRGPYTARAAVDAGLVDACVYPDQIEGRLSELAPEPPASRPGPRRAVCVDARAYHALRVDHRQWTPLFAQVPRLAYVVAGGAIHRGRGVRGIASETLGTMLDGLRRNEEVRGVVLRIDSPGGDALASDLLWRDVDRLRREKPVVASMAEVAASGGYYLASAADAVLAEPGTLTGSIGVIGGKVDLGGLYRRLGIGRDAVERGARAGLLSEARAFTEDERAAVRDEMAALYSTFIDRVCQGRGLAREAVLRVAEGRVWSGVRAQRIGLVDAIGGPLEALREARHRAGLRADEGAPLDLYPRHAGLPGLRAMLRWLA
jgi:protease-4